MSIVFIVVLSCLYIIQYIILGVTFLIAMVPYTCWMHLIRGVSHCYDQIVYLSMYIARPFQSRWKVMALISLMSTSVFCMVTHVRVDFEWRVIIAAVVSRLAWSMYCQNTPRVIFEAVYTLLSPAALISFYRFICSSHAFEFEALQYLIFLTAAFDRRLHFNGNVRCILASLFSILPVLANKPWYLAVVTATLIAIWPSLNGQSASSSSKNVVDLLQDQQAPTLTSGYIGHHDKLPIIADGLCLYHAFVAALNMEQYAALTLPDKIRMAKRTRQRIIDIARQNGDVDEADRLAGRDGSGKEGYPGTDNLKTFS